jgi:hypothetical protein
MSDGLHPRSAPPRPIPGGQRGPDRP